ncbi:hypothetical protein BDV40DRAFT_260715 [Aspergillus tamarii]|uniref:Uncharacterized protein n=1 Tax=Aspergillus tamarii TaxID=41984 RepID=A0A5N6V2L1_ASPTM|nr:hypothetical protein BDV40DRAFT_260715 [Aspergillus tamarii]
MILIGLTKFWFRAPQWENFPTLWSNGSHSTAHSNEKINFQISHPLSQVLGIFPTEILPDPNPRLRPTTRSWEALHIESDTIMKDTLTDTQYKSRMTGTGGNPVIARGTCKIFSCPAVNTFMLCCSSPTNHGSRRLIPHRNEKYQGSEGETQKKKRKVKRPRALNTKARYQDVQQTTPHISTT